MEQIYKKLNLPAKCLYPNPFISKKSILENNISFAYKKFINEDISKILWKYSIQTDFVNIAEYQDEEKLYNEIDIIEINVNNKASIEKIKDLFFLLIPHPIILFIVYKQEFQISIAFIKNNLPNLNKKIEYTNSISTNWLNLNKFNFIQANFIENLNIQKQNFTNFYETYKSYSDRIILYNISILKNKIISNLTSTNLQNYNNILQIEQNILQLKSKMKSSFMIKDTVMLNSEISRLTITKNKLLEEIN